MKIPFDENSMPDPKPVFRFFREISQIPRPSYQEKAISDYLVKFAEERGLEVHQDDLYNVIMIKEASAGREGDSPVILQGHMDMVCEKSADCSKNMETEGLDLVIDGDWLSAEGTTLGGDDGIAVAYALALLDDDNLSHPRLEFVCTVSEEVGMEGAVGIDLSPVKGRQLLNLDSEEEGSFLAGCAGGAVMQFTSEYRGDPALPENPAILRVRVSGLTGGHSGSEIHRGRANAHRILGRVLQMARHRIRVLSIHGGTKDNAIPREAEAVIVLPGEYAESFAEHVRQLEKECRNQYRDIEPNLGISVSGPEEKDACFKEIQNGTLLNEEETAMIAAFLCSVPDGVIQMSEDVSGMTDTSLNLGVARLENRIFFAESLLRSMSDDRMRLLQENVLRTSQALQMQAELKSEYPAWEYVQTSPLRDKLCQIYKELTGRNAEVTVIHAGVECGILAEKLPGLDAVSMGPDILHIHTPEERMSVSSVAVTYELVKRFLEERN